MVQRRRLEDSLFLEIDQTNGCIQFYLEEVREELYASLTDMIDEKGLRTVVAGPDFYLEPDRSIGYPRLDPSAAYRTADLFHWRYLNFFSGQKAIPVYSSIVEEYREEILQSAEEEAEGEGEQAPAEPARSEILNKQAAGAFEADIELQDRVYDLAEEEGQLYLQRNVLPTQNLEPQVEEPGAAPSWPRRSAPPCPTGKRPSSSDPRRNSKSR